MVWHNEAVTEKSGEGCEQFKSVMQQQVMKLTRTEAANAEQHRIRQPLAPHLSVYVSINGLCAWSLNEHADTQMEKDMRVNSIARQL